MKKKIKLPSDYIDFNTIGIAVGNHVISFSTDKNGKMIHNFHAEWANKKKTEVRLVKNK